MEIRDIMTRSPITIGPDAPLGTALEVMIERKIRHLRVTSFRVWAEHRHLTVVSPHRGA
jgi:CBS domain-containing protein